MNIKYKDKTYNYDDNFHSTRFGVSNDMLEKLVALKNRCNMKINNLTTLIVEDFLKIESTIGLINIINFLDKLNIGKQKIVKKLTMKPETGDKYIEFCNKNGFMISDLFNKIIMLYFIAKEEDKSLEELIK